MHEAARAAAGPQGPKAAQRRWGLSRQACRAPGRAGTLLAGGAFSPGLASRPPAPPPGEPGHGLGTCISQLPNRRPARGPRAGEAAQHQRLTLTPLLENS